MDARNLTAIPHSDAGSLEVIVPDGDAAIRWSSHGYPSSLAKWHYHPQIEIHLIREGSGQLMAGDGLMPFVPGHVAMIGSNLPHNWLSDIIPGERLSHRDVLCHIRPQTMRLLTAAFPETSGFETVLRRSQHALVLFGDSAREAGELLVAMGEHSPVRRVADLIAILTVFEQASAQESQTAYNFLRLPVSAHAAAVGGDNVTLVEDDAALQATLVRTLLRRGFGVTAVGDGAAALERWSAAPPDAVVLDLTLPTLDGLQVLAEARARGLRTPVLILTARGTVGDRVLGLNTGADDYLAKPFDLDELAARLRALARRARGRAEASLRHGEVVLDPAARSVTLRGEPVVLTGREFDLLQMLLEAAGRVLTRRGLDEQLYAWGEAVGSNALEVHIHHLRKKLGADLIRTVRGVGYMVDEAPR